MDALLTAEPLFYLIAVPVVLIVGIGKDGFGGDIPLSSSGPR